MNLDEDRSIDGLPGWVTVQADAQTEATSELVMDRLRLVMKDNDLYEELLKRRCLDAQDLMDTLQTLLDDDSLKDRRSLIVILEKLSKSTNMYPHALILEGIESPGEVPENGGRYADIYKSTLGNHGVCLKWIRSYKRDNINDLQEKFCRATVVWRQLVHPNVQPFIGLARIGLRLFCVTPWVENGDVNQYLKQNPNANRLLLATDVAVGLDFLHTNEIIHGDLKGSNILIDESGRARIADFDLSSITDFQSNTWTAHPVLCPGTLHWQAPELFDLYTKKCNKLSKASDAYAWACVCYEIFTGQKPFFDVSPYANIPQLVKDGTRPSAPHSSSRCWSEWGLTMIIWKLMDKCWVEKPEARPTIENVVSQLSNGVEDTRPELEPRVATTLRSQDTTSHARALEVINAILTHQKGPFDDKLVYDQHPVIDTQDPSQQKHELFVPDPPPPGVLFYVEALFDYMAMTDEEFDFRKGDIIAVTATPEDGWWSGELLDEERKQKGCYVFPKNFIQPLGNNTIDNRKDTQIVDPPVALSLNMGDITSIKALFYARAMYSYTATTDDEFNFQVGDIIAVNEIREDGWWAGELLDEKRRLKGLLPSNFVERMGKQLGAKVGSTDTEA